MNDLRPGVQPTIDFSSFNWWGLLMVIMGGLWIADMQKWLVINWNITPPLFLVFAGVMAFMPRRRHL